MIDPTKKRTSSTTSRRHSRQTQSFRPVGSSTQKNRAFASHLVALALSDNTHKIGTMRRILFAVTIISLPVFCAAAENLDFVLANGRVIDPATRLDGRRHIGIKAGKIAALSETPLSGGQIIDVSGFVVAPGFIDINAHGQNTHDLGLKVRDGVTTAIETDHGVYPVAAWYQSMEGKAPVNYGASVSQMRARYAAFNPQLVPDHRAEIRRDLAALGKATIAQVEKITQIIQSGLDEGALGIGISINYTPAADNFEIEEAFRVAARAGVPLFAQPRQFGIVAIREMIDAAEKVRAALHLAPIGSFGSHDLPEVLQLIDSKRASGMDLSTEVYPYVMASTLIESGMFDGAWQERLGVSHSDVVWAVTGERLTAESFVRYRKQGGRVFIRLIKEENVERALRHPAVMIGGDGPPFVNGVGHPRGTGSFARVLGHYSRTKNVIPLMTALEKMTILPAKRLNHVPAMRNKGRIAVGMDADLTVFDAEKVIDRATFEAPMITSVGIAHVIVNGTFVVRNGELLGTMAGRPVRMATKHARQE